MIQDAINALSGLQKNYINSYSIEVFPDGSMIFHYQEDIESDEVLQKEFDNAQELLEWMENNLTEEN